MSFSLYPHQKEAIKYALIARYSICSLAMGLGKSLVAIECMKRIGGKAVVVCPAFLKLNWCREIEKFSKLRTIVLQKDTSFTEYDVAIVSYSSLHKFKNLFKEAKIVVADECHLAKNPQARRTQALHEHIESNKPEYFIGLTGTAIKNRVNEFYSLLVLCGYNPVASNGLNIFDKYPTYSSFCRHFSNEKTFKVKGRWVVKYEGHRHVDELRTYLKDKYLRRKASDVLDLPPIVRKDIILDDHTIDYDLLKAWQDRGGKTFIEHKVNSAKIKVSHTVKYAKELMEAGEGPLIIFSDHVEPTQEIAKALKGYACITGQTPMKLRDKYVQQFQDGKLKGIAATIGSLSVGVTLTRGKNMIFNDLPFVPGDIAQAEKRIHRIGQTGHCTIHRIFWGKIDVKIGRDLDKKIKTLVEVL